MDENKISMSGMKCAFCGCDLPSGRSRFCSDKCKNAFKHYRMSKAEVEARRVQKCLWCGRTFTHKFVGMRFCSDQCRKSYYNNGMKSLAEVQTEHERTCPICGKKYVAYNTSQIYCSETCRSASRNIQKTFTPDDAMTGHQDPYAKMMMEKAKRDADLDLEFETVTNLPDAEKRAVVASWAEEKRNALRTFYIRKHELSSGRVLRTFGREEEKTDAQKEEERIVADIRSVFERRTFDEDNVGFENT